MMQRMILSSHRRRAPAVRGGHRLQRGTRLAFLNVLLVHDCGLLLAPGHVSFVSGRGEGTATPQTEVAGHVISFVVEELILKGAELKFKANNQGNESASVAESMLVVQRHISTREGSISLFPCFSFAN